VRAMRVRERALRDRRASNGAKSHRCRGHGGCRAPPQTQCQGSSLRSLYSALHDSAKRTQAMHASAAHAACASSTDTGSIGASDTVVIDGAMHSPSKAPSRYLQSAGFEGMAPREKREERTRNGSQSHGHPIEAQPPRDSAIPL
jgi:hypothetical protein